MIMRIIKTLCALMLVAQASLNASFYNDGVMLYFSNHPTLYITHCGVFENCRIHNSYSHYNQESYPETDTVSHAQYPETSSTWNQATYPESQYQESVYPESSSSVYSEDQYDERPTYPEQMKNKTFISKLHEFQAISAQFNKAKEAYLEYRNRINDFEKNYTDDEHNSEEYRAEKEQAQEDMYQQDEIYERAMRTYFKDKKQLVAKFNVMAARIAKWFGASAVHKYGGRLVEDDTVVYVNPDFDITDRVVELMNMEYDSRF